MKIANKHILKKIHHHLLLKLIKIFDSDYVTYIVRGLGPVFPDILFLRRVSGYYFHPAHIFLDQRGE